MRQLTRFFYKDREEDEWVESHMLVMDNSYFPFEKVLMEKHNYVRKEMEKRSSRRTFVHEWSYGVLTHIPTVHDAPCKASGFNEHHLRRLS